MKLTELLRAGVGFAGVLLIFATLNTAPEESQTTATPPTTTIQAPIGSHPLTPRAKFSFAQQPKYTSRSLSTSKPEATPAPTICSTPTPTPTATPEPTPTPLPTYTFLATAYSSAPEENGGYGAVDCKYGNNLPRNAIAADLRVLPYGTRVWIDGLGERIVVDTASRTTINKMNAMAESRGADGWIDIYVGDNTQDAWDWGIRNVTLTILEWGTGK